MALPRHTCGMFLDAYGFPHPATGKVTDLIFLIIAYGVGAVNPGALGNSPAAARPERGKELARKRKSAGKDARSQRPGAFSGNG